MSEQVIKLGRKAQEDREIKDFRTMERCVGTEHPVTRNGWWGKRFHIRKLHLEIGNSKLMSQLEKFK